MKIVEVFEIAGYWRLRINGKIKGSFYTKAAAMKAARALHLAEQKSENLWAALGKKGGSVKSERKAAAVRLNGQKGGRPRKAAQQACPSCGAAVQVLADGRCIRHFDLRQKPIRWCACWCIQCNTAAPCHCGANASLRDSR